MSQLEQQLRQALRELADEVPATRVPPLRLPARQARRSGPSHSDGLRFRGASRWLAPLAAAASVLVVAAGIAASAGLIGRGGPESGGRTITTGSVPPYYVALAATGAPDADHVDSAGIYATATGALLASVSVPGRARTFVGASAAANDLTFAVAAEQYPARRRPAVRFYLIRFDPSRRSARLSPLARPRVPAGASLEGFALSPDARRLAVAVHPKGAHGMTAEIRMLTISTGAVRTWASSRGTLAAGTVSSSLSWADDNTTLAFNWHVTRLGGPAALAATTSVRLLDVRRPGGDLMADSHLVVRFSQPKNHQDLSDLLSGVATLTPDGKSVVAAASSPTHLASGFVEFSALTGQMVRKVWWGPTGTPAPAGSMAVLWSSKSGRTLVVSSPPGHPGQLAIVGRSRLRLLPWPAQVPFAAAAW